MKTHSRVGRKGGLWVRSKSSPERGRRIFLESRGDLRTDPNSLHCSVPSPRFQPHARPANPPARTAQPRPGDSRLLGLLDASAFPASTARQPF